MSKRCHALLPAFCALFAAEAHARSLAGIDSATREGRSWMLRTTAGQTVRITPYGDYILRVQAIDAGQTFAADDRWGMVESHDWPGALTATDTGAAIRLAPRAADGLAVEADEGALRLRFLQGRGRAARELLRDDARGVGVGGRVLALAVDGGPATPVAFPPTARWDQWQTAAIPVALAAGPHKLRFFSVDAGGGPNLDWLEVGGQRLQAEAAQLSGVAPARDNGGYDGSGYADFSNSPGDWLEFDVNPAAPVTALAVRYANGEPLAAHFAPVPGERFTGLGHGPYGRVPALELTGGAVARNRETQAALVVPFFLSSRGYGVFLNTLAPNNFSFTAADYALTAQTDQLDYFVIAGPDPATIVDRYTQLTGRPRLPPLAALGLGLSDKEGDTLPSSAAWWKTQVDRLQQNDWTLSWIVHDNSWRNGKTAPWAWDLRRYPDPAGFAAWCRERGVLNMLDFNRADAPLSAGWRADYLLPGTGDFPNFYKADARAWFWGLLRDESFANELHYPADFLWLDEFDEPAAAAGNDYLFLMAKSVGEGWARDVGPGRRPFVMARGMSAGAQRWASLWSGDINATEDEMRWQIRGMLAAGLAGFPFWTHDAGGFLQKPGDDLYERWGLAMGAFTPVWKPHGIGFRFPWTFDARTQALAASYAEERARLIPYLNTYARQAGATGAPMARAMLLDYPAESAAWTADLQWLLGRELLVAPDTGDGHQAWLPPGLWYSYWDDARATGPAPAASRRADARIPVFVRAGAVLPRTAPTPSAMQWDHARLALDVYAGADGRFTLLEDDGLTEAWRTGASRASAFAWNDARRELRLAPATGAFDGAPAARTVTVKFHGLPGAAAVRLNGAEVASAWDAASGTLTADLGAHDVDEALVVAVGTSRANLP